MAKNKAPAASSLAPVDKGTFSLAGDVVKGKADSVLDDLKTELGPAASNPAVQKILAEFQTKLDNGQEITPDDIIALSNAATATGTLGASSDALVETSGKLIGLSQANAALQTSFPTDVTGLTPTLTGLVGVVTMPSLPAGQVMVLPNGDLMVGTGGSGDIGYVQADAADLLDTPIGVGDPVADDDSTLAGGAQSGVLLMNPNDSGSTVNYSLTNAATPNSTGYNYSMSPGQIQRLPDDSSWLARFDRGGGSGEVSYTLRPGTYVFGASEKGWELYRHTFSVTIDNGKNEDVFNYNVDNSQQVIGAHTTRTHTSDYPIIIRFDRGDGQTVQKKVNDRGSTMTVAADSSGSFWDLYPADNFPRAQLGEANTADFMVAPGAFEDIFQTNSPPSDQSTKAARILKKLKALKKD